MIGKMIVIGALALAALAQDKPVLINKVKPVYPPLAKEARITGLVKLDVSIDDKGKVAEVRVVSGHPLLVNAAMEAVRQWEYKPGPPVVTQVVVNFELPHDAARPPANVKGSEQVAKLTHKVRPVYPPEAKVKNVSGTVNLEALIDKEGKVAQVRVIEGDPLLAEAAVDAVRQWEYEPTLLNGDAVEVITSIDVNFTLAN